MLTLFLGTQTKKTALDSLARSYLVVRDASRDLTKTLILMEGGLSPYFPHTPPLKEMSSWTLQRWPNHTITISNMRRDKKKNCSCRVMVLLLLLLLLLIIIILIIVIIIKNIHAAQRKTMLPRSL